jgi:hypothetical protein
MLLLASVSYALKEYGKVTQTTIDANEHSFEVVGLWTSSPFRCSGKSLVLTKVTRDPSVQAAESCLCG